MKRVGILGGTFNPVHFGHLKTALEVCERFSLDSVLFIPTYIPPHKMDDKIVPPDVRLEMLKLAVSDIDCFRVSDVEITKQDISYSIDTVKMLKESSDDVRYFFIVGADAFYEISTWNNYKELILLVDFIVMTRPGTPVKRLDEIFMEDILKDFSYDSEAEKYVSTTGTEIHFYKVTKVDISSTEIRERVRTGKSINHLVPASVEEFILQNNLYK